MTAAPKLRAIWVGQAVPRDLTSVVVLSSFSAGAYVRAGTSVLAVGEIPAGPLHITASLAPPPLEGRAPFLGRPLMDHGRVEIDTSRARRWIPAPLDRGQLCRASRTLSELPQLTPVPLDVASVWSAVVDAVACGDLPAAFGFLEGRGNGLTPTGDDVLAGLLVIHAFENQDPGLVADRLAVACSAKTTDLSRSFLHWAAKGQSIEPVHRFLECAAAGDLASTQIVAQEVAAIGASSGQAILSGLALGLDSLSLPKPRNPTLASKALT